MQKQDQSGCSSVRTTLDVIGGKWKPLIMFLLVDKTMRFSELQRSIVRITQKMLTEQLRELEKDGLISRKVYPQVPPKVEYTITNYGRTLLPVLETMHKWGQAHKSEAEQDIEVKIRKSAKTSKQITETLGEKNRVNIPQPSVSI